MIKACMKLKDGGEIVVIGLSYANLDRLRTDGLDGFIKIERADGFPVEIVITAAETEHAMMDFFGRFIGPDTKVKIDERLKS